MACSNKLRAQGNLIRHKNPSNGSKPWIFGEKYCVFRFHVHGDDRHSANGLMGLALSPLEPSFCRRRYYEFMSRLALILLIALLPLRGWSADRMFLSMAFNESASHSMDMPLGSLFGD
jgi:hypothetical protein